MFVIGLSLRNLIGYWNLDFEFHVIPSTLARACFFETWRQWALQIVMIVLVISSSYTNYVYTIDVVVPRYGDVMGNSGRRMLIRYMHARMWAKACSWAGFQIGWPLVVTCVPVFIRSVHSATLCHSHLVNSSSMPIQVTWEIMFSFAHSCVCSQNSYKNVHTGTHSAHYTSIYNIAL